jgi:hypothetical protein
MPDDPAPQRRLRWSHDSDRCPLCGRASVGVHRVHLACIQRARQLSTRWDWISGERAVWPS